MDEKHFTREINIHHWESNEFTKGKTSNYIKTSKYTVYNFIPLVLFEQFQKLSIFYFLIGAVVNLCIDSPAPTIAVVTPLIILTSITLIARAYEDIKRYMSDKEVNERKALVLRCNNFVPIDYASLKLGDVVKVENNCGFPSDLLLLYSSRDEINNCSVTTANLDGESSLKTFYGIIDPIKEHEIHETLMNKKYSIKLTEPSVNLYKFFGVLNQHSDSILNLSEKNILLRGAKLKNTEYIVGCVIYIGADTKLSLNTNPKKLKHTNVDKRLNIFVLIFLIVQIIISLCCAIIWNVKFYNMEWMNKYYYVPQMKIHDWKRVESFFIFFVTFIRMVPISLIYSIYGLKAFASFYFTMDLELYHEETDQKARANTIELLEELGQVEYLFTDKTGTLTENLMEFHSCAVLEDGIAKVLDKKSLLEKENRSESVSNLFHIISLCHTVHVSDEHNNPNLNFTPLINLDNLEYQATSPDEEALLTAIKECGFVYLGSKLSKHFVLVDNVVHEYIIKDVLEFDSTRKCMSVILHAPKDDSYWLLCKGAESTLFTKTQHVDQVQKFALPLNQFADNGLRILVAAHRRMSKEEVDDVLNELEQLRKNPAVTEQMWTKMYDKVERDLELIGVTAVQDKLQEDVPDTLESLRRAGIKIWVITGDKEETAINISYSSGHFSKNVVLHRITKIKNYEDAFAQLRQLINFLKHSEETGPNALVVDGDSFQHLISIELIGSFMKVASRMSAVLCCRMTPLQKAQVVTSVRDNTEPTPITVAIGDGGNDVSMILEASVGLAVFGREGRQAVRASDYAIPRFKHLKRTILYHGQCFYERLATFILFYLYKSIMYVVPLMCYVAFSCASSLNIYDDVVVAIYNITFTTPSIFLFGIFDHEQTPDTYLNKPELYSQKRQNSRLGYWDFFWENILGISQSVFIFFLVYSMYTAGSTEPAPDFIGIHGNTHDFKVFGGVILYNLLFINIIRVFLISHNINWVFLIGAIFSVVGSIAIEAIVGLFVTDWSYKLVDRIFSEPINYFIFFVCSLFCSTYDILLRLFRQNSFLQHMCTINNEYHV